MSGRAVDRRRQNSSQASGPRLRRAGAQAMILPNALVPSAARRFLIGTWIATGRIAFRPRCP